VIQVDESQRLQIIDEVRALAEAPTLGEDEFTVRQYADRAGISIKLARNHLLAQVDDGVLEKRKVKHAGSRCWAFRKREEDE
jgi:hypothetical protein